jgi:hypothetical protein
MGAQRSNPLIYKDCSELHARLVKMEAEYRKLSPENPDNWSREKIDEFLKDEADLWERPKVRLGNI